MTVFYPDNDFPATPVPVVYVLDGFWWSDMAAGVISDLSSDGKIPKCLMVSLDYKKGDGVYARSKDLVYPGEGVQEPAEAEKFFRFLNTELVPQVEANYPCDTTQRVLFGHSLGGLFTLYSLLDHAASPLFTKCIAASCSMGMGVDNYVFQKESEVATQVSDLPVTLFIGSGTYVGSSPIMHQEFYHRLKARAYPHLKVGFALYPEQHGTDPYPTFIDGIQFVFTH
ncbi:MAG: alpha/beta hydrolase [Bacteroidetes bacterium]|nr:alpha/beta hydrolase [Bacteroidota bacterium]